MAAAHNDLFPHLLSASFFFSEVWMPDCIRFPGGLGWPSFAVWFGDMSIGKRPGTECPYRSFHISQYVFLFLLFVESVGEKLKLPYV